MQLESSVTLFDDNKVESKFAELQVTADGITSEVSRKVGNNEVISRINQSAESVTINAGKINIAGVITAINNDGTTTINGGKITTGTLNASAVKASSGTFNTANIPNLSADKITSGTINASLIASIGNPSGAHSTVTANGLDIYGSNGTTNIASFGTNTRIGTTSANRIELNGTAIINGETKTAIVVTTPTSGGGIYCNENVAAGTGVYSGGYVHADGQVWVGGTLDIGNNASNVRFTDSGGTFRNNIFLNSSNQFTLGYGQYLVNNSAYTTSVQGYNVSFTARNAIQGNKAYTNTSDARLKKDFETLDKVENFFLELEPVEYSWKNADIDDTYDSYRHFGLKAQDVETAFRNNGLDPNEYGIITETTHQDGEEYKGLAYSEFIPVCIHMIQKLYKEVERLKAKEA